MGACKSPWSSKVSEIAEFPFRFQFGNVALYPDFQIPYEYDILSQSRRSI